MKFYGSWVPDEKGIFSFKSGAPKHEPYLGQFRSFSKIKNSPYISMHGYSIRHLPKGKYSVSGEVVDHGNLSSLTLKIFQDLSKTIVVQNMKSINGKFIQKISSKKCALSIIVKQSLNDFEFDLRDANGHIVYKEKFSKKIPIIPTSHAALIMAKYLSHEHHRACIAIHKTGNIRHAADHIPMNTNPCEYWPEHSHGMFTSNVPLIQFDDED